MALLGVAYVGVLFRERDGLTTVRWWSVSGTVGGNLGQWYFPSLCLECLIRGFSCSVVADSTLVIADGLC